MDIGAQIRKFRRERDWTQAELAEFVGIDKRNISRYESGNIEPRKSTLLKFADALHVDVQDLLGVARADTNAEVEEDPELSRLFRDVSKLPEKDKEALKRIISLVVRQNRIQEAMAI